MNDSYLTNGSVGKGLLRFAVPVLFSSLFQTLYNTADTVIVGWYLGDTALAAMGAVAALFELIVGFSVGCSNGFAIIAGQKYGAADEKGLKKTCAMSLYLSLGLGILLTAVFFFAIPDILNILQTADEVYSMSLGYIRIIIGGLVITILYNFEAGMLRAIGDSVSPLVVLALSSILNIFLDIVFLMNFHMGVEGTAWATLCSQALCTILCLVWILMKRKVLVPRKTDWTLDLPLCKALAEQGLAMGLMSSIVSIGTVILQSAINQMDLTIQTAHAAVRKMMSLFTLVPNVGIVSASAFTAQNTGAGKYERVTRGILLTNRFMVGYSVVMTICAFTASNALVHLFSGTNDPNVIFNGSLYLKTNLPFFFALGILCTLRSSLQALGEKKVPVISSFIELAGKLVFTWFIIPFTGYIGVCVSEPFVWVLMMIYLARKYERVPMLEDSRPKVV